MVLESMIAGSEKMTMNATTVCPQTKSGMRSRLMPGVRSLNDSSIRRGAFVGIDRIVKIVKVQGFVASAEGFTGQPRVVNGASEFLGRVFGEAGKHARSAVGVAELPMNSPVEVELTVELK